MDQLNFKNHSVVIGSPKELAGILSHEDVLNSEELLTTSVAWTDGRFTRRVLSQILGAGEDAPHKCLVMFQKDIDGNEVDALIKGIKCIFFFLDLGKQLHSSGFIIFDEKDLPGIVADISAAFTSGVLSPTASKLVITLKPGTKLHEALNESGFDEGLVESVMG